MLKVVSSAWIRTPGAGGGVRAAALPERLRDRRTTIRGEEGKGGKEKRKRENLRNSIAKLSNRRIIKCLITGKRGEKCQRMALRDYTRGKKRTALELRFFVSKTVEKVEFALTFSDFSPGV